MAGIGPPCSTTKVRATSSGDSWIESGSGLVHGVHAAMMPYEPIIDCARHSHVMAPSVLQIVCASYSGVRPIFHR